jgi:N-glycosylase/DNA lyase
MLSTPLRFLAVLPRELSLATVLKSGQSFRWHRFEAVHATRPDSSSEEVRGEEWAFGWGDRTVCLRQGGESLPLVETRRVKRVGVSITRLCGTVELNVAFPPAHGIHYRSLFPLIHRPAYIEDLLSDTTLPLLRAYFQLDTPLAPLYAEWAARDPNFKKKVDKEGARLEGIRVLSQDPWENLVSCVASLSLSTW